MHKLYHFNDSRDLTNAFAGSTINIMPSLEKATIIATKVHEGQKRFDGSSYINHPLRVKETVKIQILPTRR